MELSAKIEDICTVNIESSFILSELISTLFINLPIICTVSPLFEINIGGLK